MADGKIACKLPNGVTIAHKGETVTLNGANHDRAVAGFGITEGVDLDWFKDWASSDGKDLPFVKNGTVFVMKASDKTGEEARERRGLKSGMEPMDPNAPMPGIEPTPETKAVLSGAHADEV